MATNARRMLKRCKTTKPVTYLSYISSATGMLFPLALEEIENEANDRLDVLQAAIKAMVAQALADARTA